MGVSVEGQERNGVPIGMRPLGEYAREVAASAPPPPPEPPDDDGGRSAPFGGYPRGGRGVAIGARLEPASEAFTARARRGGSFVLDQPAEVPSVWGEGQRVAWADGEPLMITGPPGAGKTTIAQQLVLARLGVRKPTLLGLAVAPLPPGRRVLYIAADRPSQAARSLRRMVIEDDRSALDERLVIWPGPIGFDLLADATLLDRFADHHQAETIVIDSLKDVAPDLGKEEVGTRVNLALQACCANARQVLVLHHHRKASGDNKKPSKLDDVYGSRWLTAGAGSVLVVWGEPGDLEVEVLHLKQPAEDVGPLRVEHDHITGTTRVLGQVDLVKLAARPRGLTTPAAAEALSLEMNRNGLNKARRRLDGLVRSGHLQKLPAATGGAGGTSPATYVAVTLLGAL